MLNKIMKVVLITIFILTMSEARPSGKKIDTNTSSVINIDDENNCTREQANVSY